MSENINSNNPVGVRGFPLGKVHGPYGRADGHKHVVLVLHNYDGSIKLKKTISYLKYMKEVDEGLHKYDTYVKSESIRSKLKEPFVPTLVKCDCCGNTYFTNPRSTDVYGSVCSKSCREKVSRKNKKKPKFEYYKQFVVPIKENKEVAYYIVYTTDAGERESYFVAKNKCTLIISEDDNHIRRYKLHFDKTDSVRVRLVPGFKKLFWATETGIIISRRTKIVLKLHTNERGYLVHATWVGGRKGTAIAPRAHQLVARAFIKNPENKPEVNHIDGVKTNNRVTNLEWVTAQENTDHAWRIGLAKAPSAYDNPTARFSREEVAYIRNLDMSNMTRAALAERCGVSNSCISNILNYKTYIK